MSLFVFFILLSVGVSFICSMLEAVILSVTPSYLESIRKKKPKLYQKVANLREDVERPLASILTFNTIAHTAGAAGAGAEAQRLFGSDILMLFSAILTFVILFFSEIIPKSIGASSWKSLLPLAARILKPMIFISLPLVWLTEKVAIIFKKEKSSITRDEIAAITEIGFRDGALEEGEYRMMKELIQFRQIKASLIMTAHQKVEGLGINENVTEAYLKIKEHNFSRMIVFGLDRNDIKGFVLRSALQRAHIENNETSVKELTSSILILPQDTELPTLFHRLIERREHICTLIDEEGHFVGIVTLENIIEQMIGFEIFDELD